MTRGAVGILASLAMVLTAGCGKTPARPRFEGRVVSHVDEYGSGTGTESALVAKGSMVSGFNYGEPSKPDWTSQIQWCFLRQAGGQDVYRVEWTFRRTSGTRRTGAREVSFDGTNSVKVFDSQWQVISIEPGPMEKDSQPAPAVDGAPPGVPSSPPSARRN